MKFIIRMLFLIMNLSIFMGFIYLLNLAFSYNTIWGIGLLLFPFVVDEIIELVMYVSKHVHKTFHKIK